MPPKKCLLNGKNTCTNLLGRSQTETFVIDFLRVSPPSQFIERFLFYQLSSDHWLFFCRFLPLGCYHGGGWFDRSWDTGADCLSGFCFVWKMSMQQ